MRGLAQTLTVAQEALGEALTVAHLRCSRPAERLAATRLSVCGAGMIGRGGWVSLKVMTTE